MNTVPKVHFVSFYTEGEPHDRALNLTRSRDIYQNAISPYVSSMKFYNRRELDSRNETKYLVEHISGPVHSNAETEKIGYLRWKPYIILEELKKADDGDIVYYRDVNVLKYDGILTGVSDTYRTVVKVLEDTEHGDLFVPIEGYPCPLVKQYVKKEVINAMMPRCDWIGERQLYNASVVVAKKTARTIAFMEEWLEWCKDDNLLKSDYNKDIQDPTFRWNTQEQAILNMLLYKYQRPSYYFSQHRVFAIDSLRKVPEAIAQYDLN